MFTTSQESPDKCLGIVCFLHRQTSKRCRPWLPRFSILQRLDSDLEYTSQRKIHASPSSSSSCRFFGKEWTLLSTRMRGGGRCTCAYASLDDKRHFLFGGKDASRDSSSTVVEHNSTLQNWRTHPPLPGERLPVLLRSTTLRCRIGARTHLSQEKDFQYCCAATILLLLVTTTTATPSVVARRSVWTKHKKDNQER